MPTQFAVDDLTSMRKSLLEELEKMHDVARHPFRVPWMATIDGDGTSPAVRMMVCRHVLEEGRVFIFFTDKRSKKMDNLRQRPTVEIGFYSRDLGCQIRTVCDVEICDYHTLEEKYKISPDIEGVKDYKTDVPPGTEIGAADAGHHANAKDNFTALVCRMRQMDWLVLGEERNTRGMFQWDEDGICFRSTHLAP